MTNTSGKTGIQPNNFISGLFNGDLFKKQTFSLSEVLSTSDVDAIKAYNKREILATGYLDGYTSMALSLEMRLIPYFVLLIVKRELLKVTVDDVPNKFWLIKVILDKNLLLKKGNVLKVIQPSCLLAMVYNDSVPLLNKLWYLLNDFTL